MKNGIIGYHDNCNDIEEIKSITEQYLCKSIERNQGWFWIVINPIYQFYSTEDG